MNDVILLLFALTIPTINGYVFLLIFPENQRPSFLFRLATAYGLGIGFLALGMLLLGMLQIPFSFSSLSAIQYAMMGCWIIAKIFVKRDFYGKSDESTAIPIHSQKLFPLTIPQMIIWIFNTLLIIYIAQNIHLVLWRNAHLPVFSWDAIATIAFKAKIFYFEGGLPDMHLLPHKTYPLLVPFSQAWIAFVLGRWDDLLIKIIFPGFFLSFVLLYFDFLKSRVTASWALLGTAVLLSSNLFIFHATISYRDFSLMYYNCLTILLLLHWYQKRQSIFLILSALFAGFASFTKLEGTAFYPIYWSCFLFINFFLITNSRWKKILNSLIYFAISGSILLTFHLYKLSHHVLKEGTGATDKTGWDFTLSKLASLPTIVSSFSNNLFLSGNWSGVWVVFLVSLSLTWQKRKNPEILLLLASVFSFFILYICTALFTVNYEWIAGASNTTTLSRLILHFYPLACVLIILLGFPGRLEIDKN